MQAHIQKYLRGVRTHQPRGQKWSTFLRTHAEQIWACDVRRFGAYEILPGKGVRLRAKDLKDKALLSGETQRGQEHGHKAGVIAGM